MMLITAIVSDVLNSNCLLEGDYFVWCFDKIVQQKKKAKAGLNKNRASILKSRFNTVTYKSPGGKTLTRKQDKPLTELKPSQ